MDPNLEWYTNELNGAVVLYTSTIELLASKDINSIVLVRHLAKNIEEKTSALSRKLERILGDD